MRKEVNELDNLTTAKAIDSLINYETVKLFNNELLEVTQYDQYLVGFQVRKLNSVQCSWCVEMHPETINRPAVVYVWQVCCCLRHLTSELLAVRRA